MTERKNEEPLQGGNMNAPIRQGAYVIRKTSAHSASVHQLLKHLETFNFSWIPRFHGLTSEGDEVLDFIKGEVPHEMPSWIWEEQLLMEVAQKMRLFHEATASFPLKDLPWNLPSSGVHEVICHNDFAPYNCVFRNNKLVGLIDLEICSPGSRLWDICYSVYRFAPFQPSFRKVENDEISPFPLLQIKERTALFLDTYANGDPSKQYSIEELLLLLAHRLEELSKWTLDFGTKTKNPALLKNAVMYRWHAEWVRDQV